MKVSNKVVLFLAAFLLANPVMANPVDPCSKQATRAALKAYFAMGTIPRDEAVPSHRLLSIENGVAEFTITINGNNEDGDTWSINYRVAANINNACKVLSVRKTRTF